jgi:DNA-binding transcriptional regulator WhiA
LGITWNKIAEFLGINRSMVFFYLNEHSKLPYDKYINLCRLSGIKPLQKILIVEIKNKEQEINIPSMSPELAEFLGALAGDGHMNDLTYEVSISMDRDLDNEYSKHVTKLFKKLFMVNARRYTQIKYNKVKCFAYSKKLVEFLSSTYCVPIGKKKGKLHIPYQIKKDNRLLRRYIRGVFDTDGSFHRHRPKDAMLGLISRDDNFIKELETALKRLGFSTSLNKKNLYIYKKDEIDNFFKDIKPSNSKHNTKFRLYKINKTVPLTKELIKR